MGLYVIFIGNIMGSSILTNLIQALGGVLIYLVVLFISKDQVASMIVDFIKKKVA